MEFRLQPSRRALAALVSLAVLLSGESTAWSAVPAFVPLDGRLVTVAGGPVADGEYAVTFSLYGAADAVAATWQEQAGKLVVKGGAFSFDLGSTKALDQGLLAAGKALWLGVTVGAEPELPRTPLGSVLYARRAQVAEGLDCSGCVGAGAIDPLALAGFAKTADLAAYAKATDLGAYAKTASLAKVATSGNYGDLVGLPVLAKVDQACGSGLVVKGLKADGSLDCVAAVASIAGVTCALGSVVTGFSAAGVPLCSKLSDVSGAAGATTVYLEPAGCGNHITTTAICLAVACDYANGVTGYWNCKGSYCNNLPPSKCPTTLLGTLVVGP